MSLMYCVALNFCSAKNEAFQLKHQFCDKIFMIFSIDAQYMKGITWQLSH